jgi:hypothetical protein
MRAMNTPPGLRRAPHIDISGGLPRHCIAQAKEQMAAKRLWKGRYFSAVRADSTDGKVVTISYVAPEARYPVSSG